MLCLKIPRTSAGLYTLLKVGVAEIDPGVELHLLISPACMAETAKLEPRSEEATDGKGPHLPKHGVVNPIASTQALWELDRKSFPQVAKRILLVIHGSPAVPRFPMQASDPHHAVLANR